MSLYDAVEANLVAGKPLRQHASNAAQRQLGSMCCRSFCGCRHLSDGRASRTVAWTASAPSGACATSNRTARAPFTSLSRYVKDTGEVCAVKQTGGPHDTVQVLGVVPADDVADGEVWCNTLDRLLDGWAEADHGWRLSWIEDMLRGVS